MVARDGRIGAMMGGVSRSVGNDTADLGALERRRAQAEKLQRQGPQVPFAEVLAAGAGSGPPSRTRGRRGRGGDPPAEQDFGSAGGTEEAGAETAAGSREAGGGERGAKAPGGGPEVRRGGPRPRGRAPLLRG